MEQIMNQYAIFIGRGLTRSAEPEMVQQLTLPVNTEHNIGIADIDRKHHERGASFLAFRSRLMSRLVKE
ncbi:hypothetical protein D3C74_381890 [compost metagenome]